MTFLLALAALALAAQTPGAAPVAAEPPTIGYADMADLAVPAPVAAIVQIDRATRLRAERAVGVRPGFTRFYVEANVLSLLKGAGGLPGAVTYLVDVPNDARGRAPRLRDLRAIVLARVVPGRAGEIQLVAPDAQLDWTPANEARLRAILTEAARPDAPPAVTGIGSAFSVAGTLPGESETQIFVRTADQRPMTISVLRRPGEQPRYAVSQTEIVDEAATPPAADSLLRYRLACGLPEQLPDAVLTDPASAERARADYQFVLREIGPCGRTRGAAAAPAPVSAS